MEDMLSRRGFLKGAAIIGAGAMGAAALGGCAPQSNDGAGAANEPEPEVNVNAVEMDGGDNPNPYDDPLMGKSADPIPPAEVPASWTYEADVIVVGTGGGGLLASYYCAEHGLKTIAIEKNSFTGGTTDHACAFVGGGNKLVPFEDDETSASYASYGNSFDAWVNKFEPCDRPLLMSLAKGSAECMDYMIDDIPGTKWVRETYPDIVSDEVDEHGERLTYQGADSILILWEGQFPGNCTDDPRWTAAVGLDMCTDFFTEACEGKGVDIQLSTEATALVMEDGRVIGVQATANGETIYLKGAKGVILAAGDMANNRAMLQRFVPTAYKGVATCCTMPWNTGECMRMAEGCGADYTGFDTFKAYSGGLDWYLTGNGSFFHYMYAGDSTLLRNTTLNVSVDGERIPNVQLGSRRYIGAQRFINAPGNRAYTIQDANWEEKCMTILKNLGSSHPITPEDQRYDKVNDMITTWTDDVEKAIEVGLIKKADTIEELAVELGLDPDMLVARVAEWNEIVEKNEDPLWGVVPAGLGGQLMGPQFLQPIVDPPFYGAANGGHMWNTSAGLRVSPDMEVINKQGEVIPGLYASGTTIGGDKGYVNVLNGGLLNGVALSFAGGYIAAKKIVSEA